MDDSERIATSSPNGQAEQSATDGNTIYCPRCLYNLRGAREAGLDCCPECGTSLDFDQLRSMAQTGLDLSGFTWWQLVGKLFLTPRRFHREMRRRHYFIRLPESRPRYVLAMVLVLAVLLIWTGWSASLLGSAKATWPHAAYFQVVKSRWMLGFVAATAFAMLIANAVERLWLHVLLAMLHHHEPGLAARRILRVANTQWVPIAINLIVAVIVMQIAIALRPHDKTAILMFAGFGLGGALLNLALWLEWARLVRTLFMCEGYYVTGDGLMRSAGWLNPGLFLGCAITAGWFVMALIAAVPKAG